nr:MAG TPA: hypothetical protein [Caudoviricetes sp.]
MNSILLDENRQIISYFPLAIGRNSLILQCELGRNLPKAVCLTGKPDKHTGANLDKQGLQLSLNERRWTV